MKATIGDRYEKLQVVPKLKIGWLCRCDCGNEKFIKSLHQLTSGHNKSCGCLNSKSGTDNAGWKGNGVGYDALHAWVRGNVQEPDICDHCRQPKKLDLANISQQYKRDLSDWQWLCRRCHMGTDGRLKWIQRDKRGTANPRVRLTEDQVRSIRTDKRSCTTISAEVGISKAVVSKIKLRQLWAHL